MSHHSHYPKGGPYRSRETVLFGVCGGIAQHLDISVFWTRVFTFVAFLFTGFFPVGVVYFALALLMKRAPIMPTGYSPSWDDRLYSGGFKREGSLDERLSRLRGAVH